MNIDPNFLQSAPEMLVKARAEVARRSFKAFVQQAWPVVEPGTPLIWGWSMDAVVEHLEAVVRRDIKRLVITVPPGASKALTHDTPILTLDGWKTHGELKAGDYVYGRDGLPKRVLAESEEHFDECYDVTFDDGSVIRASKNHEWVVERDFEDRESGWARTRRETISETQHLLTTDGMTRKGARRDRIALPQSLYSPKRHLPIDPYLLGYWLGDGSSASAYLYVSEQDLHNVAHFGAVKQCPETATHTQNFYRVFVEGLALQLRALNLLNNKHVPENYLLASMDQRLALLQGLLDSDGHCTEKGLAGFSNKNRNLVDAVLFLARSLGCKPALKTRDAIFRGRNYGAYYQVFFRPPEGMRPFRLERKNARIKPMSVKNSGRIRVRYVMSATPVGRQRSKCIEVEGGVYLAGEALVPTHNSKLTRVLLPPWQWVNDPFHKFLSASYALDLTIRDNLEARRVITSQWYVDTFGLRIAEDDGGKTGFSLETLGSLKAVTVGTGKTTGFRGDTFVIDDPINVQDANSPTRRAEALDWFREAAQNRINNAAQSAIVVIMQRIHEDDVAAAAIEMGYEHLNIPMRWDESYRRTTSIGWTDPRTQQDELMFPERFPKEWVDQTEKNMGPYAFASQYQQTPVPRKGAMFQVERIKIVDSLPDEPFITVRAWDLAGTAGAGAYTVGVRMRFGRTSGKFFVDDVVRGQYSSGAVRDLILNTAISDGVETRISLPKDPGQAGVAQIDDLTAMLAGYNVRAEAQSGSKEVRAQPLAAHIENGHMHVLQNVWTKALIEEMRFFPKGKYMDQVDATSSAFNMLAPLSRSKKRTLNLIVGGERQENFAHVQGMVANR